MPGDVLLEQDPVICVAGRGLLLIEPIFIDLEDDFVGGVAQRERDVLHVRAAQEIHDVIVKDVLLIQIGGGQDRVIGVGLVIFGEVLLHVVVKIARLRTPHFVLGGGKRPVDGAEQHADEDSNNADDQQHFNQGEGGRRVLILFHMGLDSSHGEASRGEGSRGGGRRSEGGGQTSDIRLLASDFWLLASVIRLPSSVL